LARQLLLVAAVGLLVGGEAEIKSQESSMPRRFYLSLTLVFTTGLFGACIGAVGDDAPFNRMQPRIINGTADTADTAVVALVSQGSEFCTGTLISSRVVVTAGHCLKDSGLTASQISVFFGNTVGGSGTSIKVSKWTAHPSYYEKSDGTPMNDVSVVVLAQDAPVSPMAWQSTALSSLVGQSVLMVGFGVTNAQTQTGNTTRRKVTQTISKQDGTFLYYGDGVSGTCQGDSGGPTLLSKSGVLTLVAVTSYGDESCVQLGANTRVDPYASFISGFLTSSTCTASCSGKKCGSDGCGGSCGTCASGSSCNSSGQCVSSCTASCSGKSCGSDGCGGSCGTCASGSSCSSSGQCVSSGGGSTTSCAHAICTAGTKLTSTCDSCATKVCASDSYCCSTAWDAQCVGEVSSICGKTCSSSGGSTGGGSSGTGSCSHAICSTGTGLTSGCSSCVTTICSADSYCCSTKWDAQCVSEVTQFCGQTC
jgi:secreted trypsin-like serine protease